MKNRKDFLIIFICCLISALTLPNLIITVLEEMEKAIKGKRTKIETANVFIIDAERLKNKATRESTIDELEETIFKGDNLIRSYRFYVQNGCDISKVGDFTFFLLKKEELKFKLLNTLTPFIESLPRIPPVCRGTGNENPEALMIVAQNESYTDLKNADFYYFEKSRPLFSFHRLSLKNRTK